MMRVEFSCVDIAVMEPEQVIFDVLNEPVFERLPNAPAPDTAKVPEQTTFDVLNEPVFERPPNVPAPDTDKVPSHVTFDVVKLPKFVKFPTLSRNMVSVKLSVVPSETP